MRRIQTSLLLLLLTAALQGCVTAVVASVGAGVAVANDRRTSGAYVEDGAIEAKSFDLIGKRFKDAAVHVNVTSFNRNVLISGEVPSLEIKAEVEKMVGGIENTRNVSNELAISGASSLTTRAADSLVTSEVKLRFVNDKRFNANHVKVVTENGSVFLMGLVKKDEADAAVEVARNVGGVQRVVRLFEYID